MLCCVGELCSVLYCAGDFELRFVALGDSETCYITLENS